MPEQSNLNLKFEIFKELLNDNFNYDIGRIRGKCVKKAKMIPKIHLNCQNIFIFDQLCDFSTNQGSL